MTIFDRIRRERREGEEGEEGKGGGEEMDLYLYTEGGPISRDRGEGARRARDGEGEGGGRERWGRGKR